MMNNTKDIVLSVLPLLLCYTFSLFDANYNAWQQGLCLAKHAMNRRKKNGSNGQLLVNESVTNNFGECFA